MIVLAQSYPHIKNVLYIIDRYINDAAEIKLFVFKNKYLFDFFNEVNEEYFNSQIDINFIQKYSASNGNIFLKYNLIAERYFLYKTFYFQTYLCESLFVHLFIFWLVGHGGFITS